MATTTTTLSLAFEDTAAAAAVAAPRAASRYLPATGRVLMGLTFFVFGLNGFLNFIPPPSEPLPEAMVSFGTALMKAGFMFPLIKGTEVLAGALLLSNRFVPLALTLLAPIIVNILAVHLFLAPSALPIAVVLFVLEIAMAWAYRAAFRPMLAARVTAGAR